MVSRLTVNQLFMVRIHDFPQIIYIMDRVEIVEVQNREKIKDVVLKYPEIMHPDAKRLISEEYYNLINLKNELNKTREKVWELERLYKEKEEEFNSKSLLFELEFETETTNVTIHESAVMLKGYGNDIIGKGTYM